MSIWVYHLKKCEKNWGSPCWLRSGRPKCKLPSQLRKIVKATKRYGVKAMNLSARSNILGNIINRQKEIKREREGGEGEGGRENLPMQRSEDMKEKVIYSVHMDESPTGAGESEKWRFECVCVSSQDPGHGSFPGSPHQFCVFPTVIWFFFFPSQKTVIIAISYGKIQVLS